METSLHRQLKTHYAECEADTEVTLGEFRIDAIRDGELIEIQCASLSAIRDKIGKLARKRKLRVVKPIIERRRIIRQQTPDGPVTSRRLSPKRGRLVDVFDELIFLTRVFPHRNLTLEVPLVHVEEWRLPPPKKKPRRRRYRAKHTVKDVVLSEIVSTQTLRTSEDLVQLAGIRDLKPPFDTADIAAAIDRPRWVAQRVAYVLRNISAIEMQGKKGNAILYRLTTNKRRRGASKERAA